MLLSASVFFRVHPWQKCLFFYFLFRVSASAFSVKFRVRPWLILLLLLYAFSVFLLLLFPCHSVANSFASSTVAHASGSDLIILLLRQPSLTLPALNSVSFRGKNVFSASVFFSEIPCSSVANASA